MSIIDERGYIFGVLSIVDLAVVFLLVGLVITGGALVAGQSDGEATQQIVVETGLLPEYVVDAIDTGSVPTDSVVSIDEKNSLQVQNDMKALRLRVTIRVERNGDNLPVFAQERVYVGRDIRLDLGETLIEGTITETGRIKISE